jgi:hypothetical protein
VPDPESVARASLRRSLLFYAAFLALDASALAYIVASGPEGAGYVTLFIVGAVGILLAFQVWMHVRDIGSPLAESDGVVQRKWSRADLIIAWHSYYVTVGRRVFRLTPEDHVLLDEGMYVKVVHCPRTLHVVSIHEVRGRPKVQRD